MSSKSFPKFAVLGAGHGGKAMAAHLGFMGFSVNLYNHKDVEKDYEIDLREIKARGRIELEGVIKGFGELNIVSSNIKEVIDGVDVIMVVVPANLHKYVAEACAPYLQEGQIILLNPGRTGGALEFKNILKVKGVTAEVKLAEAQTLIYGCQSTGPARSKISSIKRSVAVAALPATETRSVLEVINKAYPQFIPASSVLETSLDNMGAVFHPALTLLNSGRIESTRGEFEFYIEGATPSVCKVIETIDRERVNVARALGVEVVSAKEWLSLAYGVKGENLFEALQNNQAYKGIKAPTNLNYRYIFEDVPTGLVPFASLGDMLGAPTSTIKGIIDLASAMFETDFYERGRTVEKLGLAGLTVKDIRDMVLGRA